MKTNNFIKGGNIKLGNMGTISKLYGNDVRIVPGIGPIKGSCGSYCAGCKKACYVAKSYRYPSVILSHARTTQAIRSNIYDYFQSLQKQIDRKKKPYDIIRINQSGELESYDELIQYNVLAFFNPGIEFYVYTKRYDLLKRFTNEGEIFCDNFHVLISVWGENGIQEYLELSEKQNVNAFVYRNHEYTNGYYNEHGLQINKECNAYKNRKLNKAVTCDKCRKCFTGSCNVIACDDH